VSTGRTLFISDLSASEVAYGTAITLSGQWPPSVTPEVLVLLNDDEPREMTKMTTFDRTSSLSQPTQ
jgi:hypothetical protein